MQKISPCLWFDGQAEEAAHFYVTVFKNSRIVHKTRYVEGLPRPAGTVMTVQFILDGEEFLALNGGPQFKFSPALSLVAYCDTQQEVDTLWRKLSEGGQEGQCGWLTDKYGVSWQIVPAVLDKLMQGKDPERPKRVMQALLKMTKLDIKTLQRAYEKK